MIASSSLIAYDFSIIFPVRPGGKAINVNQLGAQAAIEALWDPATGVGSQDTVRQNLFTNTEDSWNFWWSYSGELNSFSVFSHSLLNVNPAQMN